MSYLLLRIAQLVLEDGVAIDQRLDFVGKRGEGLSQSLGEVYVGHPIDPVDNARGSLLNGVGMKRERQLMSW